MIYRLARLLLRLVRPWKRHCLIDEQFAEMPRDEAVLRLDQLVAKLDDPSANELLTRMVERQITTQPHVLSAWAVHVPYLDCLSEMLGDQEDLTIVEIGPGDTLMGAAMWLANPQVANVHHVDRYVSKMLRNRVMADCASRLLPLLLHAHRDGFANESPFRRIDLDRPLELLRVAASDASDLLLPFYTFSQVDSLESIALPSASCDFLYSNAAMEHVTDPEPAIREFFRILKPGGVTCHTIDMRDHRNFADPFRHLELDHDAWETVAADLDFPNNRFRNPHYMQCFRSAGFELIRIDRCHPQPDKLTGLRLQAEFAEVDSGELAFTRAMHTWRKPVSA